MSTLSWEDWAIWGAIILVFAAAVFGWLRHRLERIRRTMRGEDVPPDVDLG